ncbi:hypothetical protein [Streptoalloteichus hindustanus]|uniref:Uncharacterized protein n=1 Tax=Streptoalloteichus hindustanus TaxID=2017 RepID=A0A1M4VA51_STRHI|nr:hypothetical protein [Streptoalloteichus hindustanus]SHE65802.1 hypothetical protein SAMN05444320_101697 [Streptoalloteichus hindustanus]
MSVRDQLRRVVAATTTLVLLGGLGLLAWVGWGGGTDPSARAMAELRPVLGSPDPRQPGPPPRGKPLVMPPGPLVLAVNGRLSAPANSQVVAPVEKELLDRHKVDHVEAWATRDERITRGTYLFLTDDHESAQRLLNDLDGLFDRVGFTLRKDAPKGVRVRQQPLPQGKRGPISYRAFYVAGAAVIAVEGYGPVANDVTPAFNALLEQQVRNLPVAT